MEILGDSLFHNNLHQFKKGDQRMEEKNSPESIREDMKDILNIVQLLIISLENNEEDEHVIRSVNVIQRLIKLVIDKME